MLFNASVIWSLVEAAMVSVCCPFIIWIQLKNANALQNEFWILREKLEIEKQNVCLENIIEVFLYSISSA